MFCTVRLPGLVNDKNGSSDSSTVRGKTSCIICTAKQILFGWPVQGEWGVRGKWCCGREKRNTLKVLLWKPEGKRVLGWPMSRWEASIKMEHKQYNWKVWTWLTLRTALFCVITQRVAVIPYRRFGTTCRSHLHGSRMLLSIGTSSGAFVNTVMNLRVL